MILKGRRVVGGYGEGKALVSREPISFYGGVDPSTGYITEPGHGCYGECLKDRIFVFPTGKGSTVGSYAIYRMKKMGTAPAAMINRETEAIIATGCVISEIPLMDKLSEDPLDVLKDGVYVKVDADNKMIVIED
ncbi:MAG: DUF126 domain-containing protein [Candidatus Bathyarchaeia archaeon]